MVISTTVAPTTDTPVKVNVPAALAAQMANGQVLVVYYEIPADEEQPAGYQPLSSNYDIVAKLISVTLPALAYQPQSNGSYQAKLKIGIANGYNSAPNLMAAIIAIPQQGNKVTSTSSIGLSCPLGSYGCTETSMFQRNRTLSTTDVNGLVSLSSRDHMGIDLRASNLHVYSARTGVVIAVVNFISHPNGCGNYILIKASSGGYDKYCHLSLINVSQNDQVISGQMIGVSGMTTSTNGIPATFAPHLHFGLLFPLTSSCVQSGSV